MTLPEKLKTLCQELSVVTPLEDAHGRYNVQFDAQFSVAFFQHKAHDVLLTENFDVPDRLDVYWECIEKAMHSSYAWPGLSISLVFDEQSRLQVQSLVSRHANYDAFFDIANAHCGFCDKLIKDLLQPISTNFNYHAFITP